MVTVQLFFILHRKREILTFLQIQSHITTFTHLFSLPDYE